MTEVAGRAFRFAGSSGERRRAALPWIASSGIRSSGATPSRHPETRIAIIVPEKRPNNARDEPSVRSSGSAGFSPPHGRRAQQLLPLVARVADRPALSIATAHLRQARGRRFLPCDRRSVRYLPLAGTPRVHPAGYLARGRRPIVGTHGIPHSSLEGEPFKPAMDRGKSFRSPVDRSGPAMCQGALQGFRLHGQGKRGIREIARFQCMKDRDKIKREFYHF